jgi:catechol 2,3-dioxygenase-like lactoylglutathione lyase family enzyme
METPGLDHINLTVSDLERSRKFYADVLGFTLTTMPVDYANKLFAGTHSFVVGGVEICLIKHPDTRAGIVSMKNASG